MQWCKEFDIEFIPVSFSTPEGRKRTYLNACECHKFTPYEVTMWLDSDTLVLRDFSLMFESARSNQFAIAQFADWTSHSRRIQKRIKSWQSIYPNWMEAAISFGPAINCGVFSFRKDSGLMQDWHRLAIPGREFSFIPDETCCQVILPQYPSTVVSHWYNTSCKYDDPKNPECRIVHYHGQKHCRISEDGRFLNHSDMWLRQFDEVRGKLEKYVEHDRQLFYNLPRWDRCKNSL
jgi:hypothetical protein